MTFLSISIDIGDSTNAKTKLYEHAKAINDNSSGIYRSFHEQLLKVECVFWQEVKMNNLDIHRLSIIKTIGDEIWYSYNLEGLTQNERHATTITMIYLLLNIHNSAFVIVKEDQLGLTDAQQLRAIDLPIKITVDIITNAFNTRAFREQYLKEHAHEIFSLSSRQDHVEQKFDWSEVSNRFGIPDQSKHGSSGSQSDYIGWEIDRFFRIAGKALNHTVLIGPKIILELKKNSFPQDENSEWAISQVPINLPAYIKKALINCQISVSHKKISAAELKGIGSGCSIALLRISKSTHLEMTMQRPATDQINI